MKVSLATFDGFSLAIHYTGALADDSQLQLSEYADSLSGWQRYFSLASDLLIRSDAEHSNLRTNDVVQIRVLGETEGSVKTVVEFVWQVAASEWIKKGAVATYDVFKTRLTKWIKDLAANHVNNKRDSTDVEKLAAALQLMAARSEVELETELVVPIRQKTLLTTDDDEEDASHILRVTKPRQITEQLDEYLRLATEPLCKSCTNIEVISGENESLVSFGLTERAVIAEPLSLPPPRRDWIEAFVRFVRIHKNTGRAMFYFRGESESSHGAHFSRIIDPRIRTPGNPYTTAFNDNAFLQVWTRQRAAPKGQLSVQWEITVQAPGKQGLLPWPE